MAYPYYPAQCPYATPYSTPYYATPQVSPFIPPADLLASPVPEPRHVYFADDDVRPPPPRRERRPSWYAGMPGMAPPPNPVPFPSPPMMITPLPAMVPVAPMNPLPPPMHPGHHRRRSDSYLPAPQWFGTAAAYPMYAAPQMFHAPLPSHQLHPLLNGEQPGGPALALDLSLYDFRAMRMGASGQPSGTPLSAAELAEPATHPGIRKMTITCERIPQWPIKLEPHERDHGNFLTIPFFSARDDAPITLGDVLITIHRHMQTRITQVEWKRLTPAEEVAVSKAYTRRCRTFPTADALERHQGVRRVDYLLDKYVFKGFVRESSRQEGYDKVHLVVGPAK